MSETGGLSQLQLNVLNKFRKRIKKERFLNNHASIYYSKQNSKFVIPGILITGISSVASFMATSDILGDDSKKGFSVGVGILTAGATILQSISSSFGFQSRAEQFQKAADSYDTLLTKIEFELANPNEDFNEFCNQVETDILAIKNDCKYLPPLFIHKLWNQVKNDGKHNDDGDSFRSVLVVPPNIQSSVNSININNVELNTDVKSGLTKIMNETTPLYEDANESNSNNSEPKYRSINFIEGKTTSPNNETPENLV